MIGFVISLLVTAAVLSSDDAPAEVPKQPPIASATKPPDSQAGLPDGMWPSERLTRSLLARWANRMSEKFELEPAEGEKVRKATVDRWSRFLKENRADLQPLFNEFLEMRLAVEAPNEEDVRRWADRALPALERLEAQAREATGEFRELMPPEKIAKFEAEAVKMGLGLQVATQKLKQWKDGSYEPHEVWQAPRRKRRAAKESKDREMSAGKIADASETKRDSQNEMPSPPEDQISLELVRWEKFVRDTVNQYGYDKAQQSAAQSFLSELKGRAVAHRDRYRSEMVELETRIQNNSGSDEEVADIKSDLVSLYGPIDEMFEELKTRVEGVATTQQRARAAEKKTRKTARDPKEESE